MNRLPLRSLLLAILFVALTTGTSVRAGEPAAWKKEQAAKYLDDREKAWFGFAQAVRGEGATKTSCVCCHTVVPYALARPVLRKMTGESTPTEYEQRLTAQTKTRVDGWAEVATPAYRLLYDFNQQKKKESLGTEAILNTVILGFGDLYEGKTAPGDATRRAFDNLWKHQAAAGDDKGSWDWFDFRYEPWEAKGARYYGAALAAVAVGTTPGYYKAGSDAALDAKVDLLRGYLKGKFAGETLYNRAWALWASSKLDGVLTPEERKQVIGQLLEKQQDDGGWTLPALGNYVRRDNTPQVTTSDGYATGLILHILQTAGLPRDDPKVAKGLAWLRTHQADTGEWKAVSVNKDRDPASFAGKFMSDAATAYAVLALGH